MSHNSSQKQSHELQPINPNVLQRQASNPKTSVWVAASAGSGKTKVLTDRILRLLLPSELEQFGTEPHKILALTFTKAAASEMALRITKNLSQWANETDEQLKEKLQKLLGQEATESQIIAARKLFAKVIDTPGGLKIMTIHSFCQSILSRFPLESGVSPNFKALEEEKAQKLLKQAQNNVLKVSQEEKGSPLAKAVYHLATFQNEEQFMKLLQNLTSERRQFQKILEKNFGTDGLYTALCQNFDISPGQSAEEMLINACDSAQFDHEGLKNACKSLAQGSEKTDQPRGLIIQNWIDKTEKDRAILYEDYKSAFLTKDGKVLKTLATKKVQNQDSNILSSLETEALRLQTLEDDLNAVKISTLTHDLFLFGQEVLKQYDELKSKENFLDFDDLILKTLDLLQGNTPQLKGLDTAPWVRYKLDQGIDHILVDEAQDTNPEQWEVIQALCDDFFDGSADHHNERTIFVVGDKKQSIFSFQRASPDKFQQMREWFGNKISSCENNFTPVDFNTSFRSVKSVLQLVDSVFDDPEIRQGLSLDEITHNAHRYTQAGQVELWPLFKSPEKIEDSPWTPPIEVVEFTSGAVKMANHIGETIAKWINNKEILESYDRPIEAGDIMILVRSRTKFIDQVVRALKTRNIPVSGVDRMILNDQLIVQDLCALAQFALLPEDDLTLATILKSPFIGWSEEKLFEVAYGRESSLWQSVKNTDDSKTINWLSSLIDQSGKQNPYSFFSTILQEPCPANQVSGLHAVKKRLGEDCLDPLNEFLNSALLFETENNPSLQNFLQEQLYSTNQIKREMEKAGNAVRIMTVHGAKGLQAPIVILPDTVRNSSSTKPERILWPDRSHQKLPYFCPTSKQQPSLCDDALTVIKERENEEYKRLLYVAMTRAENRLYIGGYTNSKKPNENSWYGYIEKVFNKLPNIEKIKFSDEEILRFKNPETDKPDRKQTDKPDYSAEDIKEPHWLFTPMPEEPFPPQPLTPSRPSLEEEPILSPLQSTHNSRFLRGNITHKLLQILPDLPVEHRQKSAEKYVSHPAHGLSQKIQDSIVSETLALLNHSDFAPIFGKGSIAEAPVTGFINNKTLISGQIDRLLITETEIFIIDYKTNRPPPKNLKDVPNIYQNQMQAYADVMQEIYPKRNIKAALIWTDETRLMEIPVS